MAKKFRGEDGKIYKQQKPFYQKIWFWAIVLVLGIGVVSSTGEKEEAVQKVTPTKVAPVKETEEVTEESILESVTIEEEPTVFVIGDTVSHKGYEITVNAVEYYDGTEYLTPDTGKQFVIINLTITNNTDKKESYNAFDYSLNANGNSTSLMSYLPDVESLGSGQLDPGASITSNLIGEADTSGSLKLQYQASIFNDKMIDIVLQ